MRFYEVDWWTQYGRESMTAHTIREAWMWFWWAARLEGDPSIELTASHTDRPTYECEVLVRWHSMRDLGRRGDLYSYGVEAWPHGRTWCDFPLDDEHCPARNWQAYLKAEAQIPKPVFEDVVEQPLCLDYDKEVG